MGWDEPLRIWRDLAPIIGEVPLLALVALIDAFTGLSQSAATKLGFAKRRDVVLPVVLLACEIRPVWWGDFHSWGQAFDTEPHDPVLFDAWIQRGHVERIIDISYMVLIFGCAIICAVWAKLQKRSFFIWFLAGFIGTVGTVVWLFVNRPRTRHQNLQVAGP
jgi:hypothetical protein